jgi:hypothetical protein
MEQHKYVAEGELDIGSNGFPFYIGGEGLAVLLIEHFRSPIDGEYYRLGRVRLTIERLPDESSHSG